MVKFLSAVTVLCTLYQQGYLQDNYIYPPSSATGQHETYPYWPFQAQIINGNYNPNPRRLRKPCTRRMNTNVPILEDTGSQWIPNIDNTRIVKPLEQKTLVFKSSSLKGKDFDSKPMIASDKVAELDAVAEKPSTRNKNNPDKTAIINYDPCETTTTAKEVPVSFDSVYERDGSNDNYYAEVANSNERNEYGSTSDESLEVSIVNCNDKTESDGSSRRFLTQNEQILSKPNIVRNKEQSVYIISSNKTDKNKEPKITQNNKVVAPYLQSFEEPAESRLGLLNRGPNDEQGNLIEPTKGRGISYMTDGKLMLMQITKVCYACSSLSDPTCWNPDRKTTVKYCRVGHDSCVTKTIRNANGMITIRDCARSCDDNDVTGLISRYKSCSICHYDLCNSAYSIKIHYMLISSIFALIKKIL